MKLPRISRALDSCSCPRNAPALLPPKMSLRGGDCSLAQHRREEVHIPSHFSKLAGKPRISISFWVTLFAIRRLQLIHAFKSHESTSMANWYRGSRVTLPMPCSENAIGEINSKIIFVSIFQLVSSFNHLRKPKVFPPFKLVYLICTSIYTSSPSRAIFCNSRDPKCR